VRHVQPGFGAAVIGGFLVRWQIDLRREFLRHIIAMRPDVADMAVCQPQTGRGSQQQGGQKNRSKDVHAFSSSDGGRAVMTQ
jgi:hypothetical protein